MPVHSRSIAMTKSFVSMRALCAVLLILAGVLIASTATAQSVNLTPEQQQILNQLPPTQRQQALDALRQSQIGQMQGVGQPVRETVEAPSPDLSPAIAAGLLSISRRRRR